MHNALASSKGDARALRAVLSRDPTIVSVRTSHEVYYTVFYTSLCIWPNN